MAASTEESSSGSASAVPRRTGAAPTGRRSIIVLEGSTATTSRSSGSYEPAPAPTFATDLASPRASRIAAAMCGSARRVFVYVAPISSYRATARAALASGEAPKRGGDRAGGLDPDEVAGTVDDVDAGSGDPLCRVRRRGDRHRAQRAVDEADGEPNLSQRRLERGQLGNDRLPHQRRAFTGHAQVGHRRRRLRIREIRSPDEAHAFERQVVVAAAARQQLVQLARPRAQRLGRPAEHLGVELRPAAIADRAERI